MKSFFNTIYKQPQVCWVVAPRELYFVEDEKEFKQTERPTVVR